MIYEQIPQLHSLTSDEKEALAVELLHEASKPESGEPDPAIVALLRQREADYRAAPTEVFSWDEVKQRARSGHRD